MQHPGKVKPRRRLGRPQIRRDSGAGIVNALRVSVNLVLLESHELSRPLPADDPRAVHVLTVLRRVPGDTLKPAGMW